MLAVGLIGMAAVAFRIAGNSQAERKLLLVVLAYPVIPPLRNGLKGKLLPELFRHWQQMWKILMNMKSYSLAIPFGGIQRRLLSIRF